MMLLYISVTGTLESQVNCILVIRAYSPQKSRYANLTKTITKQIKKTTNQIAYLCYFQKKY